MTAEQDEAVAHRWHLEVVQEGKLDLAGQILTTDCVIHANSMEVKGVAAAQQMAAALKAALPDMRITHHEAIASGGRVAIRWTADATHNGDYFGVPASGKRVHLEGIDFFHTQGGKLSEVWIEYDNHAVLQQMGAIPAPGQAGA